MDELYCPNCDSINIDIVGNGDGTFVLICDDCNTVVGGKLKIPQPESKPVIQQLAPYVLEVHETTISNYFRVKHSATGEYADTHLDIWEWMNHRNQVELMCDLNKSVELTRLENSAE